MLSNDDRWNVALLIATLVFLAWAVPARIAENRDAGAYQSIMGAFR